MDQTSGQRQQAGSLTPVEEGAPSVWFAIRSGRHRVGEVLSFAANAVAPVRGVWAATDGGEQRGASVWVRTCELRLRQPNASWPHAERGAQGAPGRIHCAGKWPRTSKESVSVGLRVSACAPPCASKHSLHPGVSPPMSRPHETLRSLTPKLP